jgi:hypothetical protein
LLLRLGARTPRYYQHREGETQQPVAKVSASPFGQILARLLRPRALE